jgi:hypothetical protein
MKNLLSLLTLCTVVARLPATGAPQKREPQIAESTNVIKRRTRQEKSGRNKLSLAIQMKRGAMQRSPRSRPSKILISSIVVAFLICGSVITWHMKKESPAHPEQRESRSALPAVLATNHVYKARST